MRIRPFRTGEEGLWRGFISDKEKGLLGHRIEWREILRDCLGHKPCYLVAEGDSGITGVLPLVLVRGIIGGRSLVSLPWLDAAGPLADNEETALALNRRAVELGREEGCSYVEIRALERLEAPAPVRSEKVLMVLPLEDPDHMWKAFSAKVRNQIRKAERGGLTGESGGEERVGEFYAVFSRNMRDIGVPVWPERFFLEMVRRFGERARVLIVRRGEETVGGGILLRYGDWAVVPSASSLRTRFSLCPNHMLYWTALRTSWETGARRFDFGRSTPGSGTHRFKKQWGAAERTCFWHYGLLKTGTPPERNTASPRLKLAVEAWKRLPLPVANRLGPLIVRRIP